MTQLLPFDYGALDAETSNAVQQSTAEIKTLARRAAQDIIEIGAKLIEVKEQLGHGHWGAWLQAEFDWSPMTAKRMMSVAKKFKSTTVVDLNFSPKVLYLLAAPSVPDEVVSEVLDTARQSKVTYSDAKAAIDEYKSSAQDDVVLHIDDNELIEEREEAVAQVDNIEAFEQPIEVPPQTNMSVHYSSGTDLWSTPQDLFDTLNREFNFTLDVCATSNNAKCADYFSESENGLIQKWQGVCWMNPPYSDISEWMGKAKKSAIDGATVVCLVPARTDTNWWWNNAIHGEIRFLKGRLKFGDSSTSAPFPSATVIFYSGLPENKREVHWWNWRN